jgi:hypothetical protein
MANAIQGAALMTDWEGGVEREAGKLPMSFDGIGQIVDVEGDLTKVLRTDEVQANDNGLVELGMARVGVPGHPDASSHALVTAQGRLAIQDPRLILQYYYATAPIQMASQQVDHVLHMVDEWMTDGSRVYSSAAAYD